MAMENIMNFFDVSFYTVEGLPVNHMQVSFWIFWD